MGVHDNRDSIQRGPTNILRVDVAEYDWGSESAVPFSGNIRVATWNLGGEDSNGNTGCTAGGYKITTMSQLLDLRMMESIDVIALQELNEDAFRILCSHLRMRGAFWPHETKPMAFLYSRNIANMNPIFEEVAAVRAITMRMTTPLAHLSVTNFHISRNEQKKRVDLSLMRDLAEGNVFTT
jgi:hypothetical protein